MRMMLARRCAIFRVLLVTTLATRSIKFTSTSALTSISGHSWRRSSSSMSMSTDEAVAQSCSNSSTRRKSDNGKLRLSLGGEPLRQVVVNADRYDMATTMDVKGILWMEHINLVVTSKSMAEYFYLDFLGCTRDTGTSFHVNLGQQQFHLAEPKRNDEVAQKITGSIGLVVPSLDTLRERIPDALERCKGTKFAIVQDHMGSDDDDDGGGGGCNMITLTCPDGNVFHLYSVTDQVVVTAAKPPTPRKMENLHAEGGAYGPQRMAIRGSPGIKFVEISCPIGTGRAISNFYREILQCTVQDVEITSPQTNINNNSDEESSSSTSTIMVCNVCVGPGVHLVFVEQESISIEDTNAMKGVHVCFYANDFQGLYQRLKQRNLIWTNPRFVHLDTCDTWEEALASRTLRFKDIIDSTTGEKILELEHETRPLRHGQYLKVPKYEPK